MVSTMKWKVKDRKLTECLAKQSENYYALLYPAFLCRFLGAAPPITAITAASFRTLSLRNEILQTEFFAPYL